MQRTNEARVDDEEEFETTMPVSAYDSTKEAITHKARVAKYLHMICDELVRRASVHDDSKHMPAEYELRNKLVPLLRAEQYGSPKYRELLVEMQPALQHHWRHNTHHPEHFNDGVNGMDLVDLIEWFCDVCADQDQRGMPINIHPSANRYKLSPQLRDILTNTERMAEATRGALEPEE